MYRPKLESISDFEIFKLLLWKNWSVIWSTPHVQILTVLSPMLFSMILVFLRADTEIHLQPARKYEPINLQQEWEELIAELKNRYEKLKNVEGFYYNTFVPRLIITYAPDNVEAYHNIMEMAAERLNHIELVPQPNCRTLRNSMIINSYLAGVCFNETIPFLQTESIHSVGKYPNRLEYTLVFPSELRLYRDSYVTANWQTNNLYQKSLREEVRQPLENDGGFPGYFREGFIPIQNAVTMSYIIRILNLTTDAKLPTFKIRRFPYRQYKDDELSSKLEFYLGSVIMAGYVYPLVQFTKHIVTEKTDNIIETLAIIGVQKWLHYSGWFAYGVLSLTVSMAFALYVLTMHFYSGYAVLTKSSYTALLFFFFFYNMATMSFCLLVSTFCTRTRTAVVAVLLLWFITFVPFMTAFYDEDLMLLQIIQFFFSNAVFSHALILILRFENYHNGFHWHDIIHACTIDESWSVALYIGALLAITLLYVAIALVVARLGFPELVKELLRTRKEIHYQRRYIPPKKAEVVEIEHVEKFCKIWLDNLSKSYDGERVVRNVSMQLFEDCITVLLGHNGSGKTTLLSMIAGLVTPTRGSITVHQSVVPSERAHISFGSYFGESSLYPDLTVYKQLRFFCRIKGILEYELQNEVHKYMNAMDLSNKRNVLTRDLSLRLRQHLGICCALIGYSKVVVLDEPCSHLDMMGKKLFWKLIKQEKTQRTIIMSTHSSEEAHVVADRLAIMCEGHLKYCGSTVLVRSLYGQDYSLVCVKGSYCKVEDVTSVIEKYVPGAKPISDISNELTYAISAKYCTFIGDIIASLEQQADYLDIISFEISDSSLNDIFFKLGVEDSNVGSYERLAEVRNGKTIHYREYENLKFLQKPECATGCQLWLLQWHAMLLKHLYYLREQKVALLLELTIPILITSLSFIIFHANDTVCDLPPITFEFDQYQSAVSFIETRPLTHMMLLTSLKLRENIKQVDQRHTYRYIFNETFIDYILARMEENNECINRKMLMGVTFQGEEIEIFFNNHPLHTAPLTLNKLHSSLLKVFLGSNALIRVSFHPLPFVHDSRVMNLEAPTHINEILAVKLVMIVCIIWSLCVIFLVRERKSRFKLMQHIAGCHMSTFWATEFFFDMCKIVVSAATIVITTWLFNRKYYYKFAVPVWHFVILVIGGFSIVSFNYLLSIWSKGAMDLYSLSIMFNILGTVSFLPYFRDANKGIPHLFQGILKNNWHLRIFPTFSISNALMKVLNGGIIDVLCDNEEIHLMSVKYEKCQIHPNCCESLENEYNYFISVSFDLILVMILGMACWIDLRFLEHRVIQYARMCFRDTSEERDPIAEYERLHRYTRISGEGLDILREMKKVMDFKPEHGLMEPLVCDGVQKMCNNRAPIHNLYFTIGRGECLAIPSVYGSGLTTLFKVLSGELKTTSGDVFVQGVHLKYNGHETYKYIGYCPVTDPLLSEFTAAETMRILCLLYGIPSEYVDDVCQSWAKVLGFYAFLNKPPNICTRGIRRRITCACAFIKTPSVIYLDRPTSSMDSVGQRQLWYVMQQLRLHCNTAVLFSSLKPYECAKVCNRMAILSNGHLLRINHPRDFLHKIRKKYMLYVKMKRIAWGRHRLMYDIIDFVETKFRRVELSERYNNILIFSIPTDYNDLAAIFDLIQNNAFNLHIENFHISTESFASSCLHILEHEDFWSTRSSD